MRFKQVRLARSRRSAENLRRSRGRLVADHHRRSRFQPLVLGIDTTEPGIRYLAPIRYPYRIYYTVTAVAVVILHVRHSARLDPDLGGLGH